MNEEFKNKITNELVLPAYKKNIEDTIRGMYLWRKIANYSEGFSSILIGMATILSFSSGIYSLKILTFFAGCAGTVSLALKGFSTYANKESKERNKILNKLLENININQFPDIAEDLSNGTQQIPTN